MRLLLSKIGEQYDPATGKGLVGKDLTHQVITSARAWLVTNEPMNGFMNNSGLGYRISDYDGSTASSRRMESCAAAHSREVGSAAICRSCPLAGFLRESRSAIGASQWKNESVRLYDRVMAGCGFRGDHLPWRQNFMDLDPTYMDAYGDPLLRLTLDWTGHELKQMEFGERIGMQMTEALARVTGAKLYKDQTARGAKRIYNANNYNTTHIQGGAIMGASPGTSVLNPWSQHWKIPNLWLLGSCAFPAELFRKPNGCDPRRHLSRRRRADRTISQTSRSTRMTRRELIAISAHGVSAAVIAALGAEPVEGQAELRVPLRFFTAQQAKVIESACERIIPANESVRARRTRVSWFI